MYRNPGIRIIGNFIVLLLSVLLVLPGSSFAAKERPKVLKTSVPAASSPCDLPLRGQLFPAESVERGAFSIDLSKAFTTDQIAQVESNVKACQSLISSRLLGFQDKGSVLLRDKASMEGMRNIKAHIDTLKALEAEKINIRKTLSKDLSQVSLKGLYAVVLEADLKTPRDKLLDKAKKLISPQAIHDLRGVAVNSVSVVEESRLVFDRVVAETSGEMDVEVVAFEDRKSFLGKSQLLYVAVVKVNPLSGPIRNQRSSGAGVRGYVADLLSLENNALFFKKELAKYTSNTYATEKMRSLEEIVSVWQNVVQQGNAQANKKSGELLAQLARRLKEKDDEIKATNRKIEDLRKRLSEIYEQVGYRCNLVAESCLDDAIGHVDRNIGVVVNASLAEKAKEMVSAKGVVIGAGDPEREIQRLAQDFYQNLRTTYSKREQFLSLSVVDSGVLAGAVDKQGYYIVRSPREIMVYPYYDENGNMLVLEVMGFRVSQESDQDKLSPQPPPAQPPLEPEPEPPRSEPGLPEPAPEPVSKPVSPEPPKKVACRNVGLSRSAAETDPETGMKFVFVKGGCYQMGSSEGGSKDAPPHEVCLDSFYIGKYEVTQKEWGRIMGQNPSENKGGGDYPVERVNWEDARKFSEKLSALTGRCYRLPTEAEWEYAARDRGGNTVWSGIDNEAGLDAYAWHKGNSDGKTHPVGKKKPNRLGIYDMTGNVWEWVEDSYNSDAYKKLDKNNPVAADTRWSWSAVRRGGSCETKAERMKNVSRDSHRKGKTSEDHGFRIVLPAPADN
ncbi:serine/threonine-protein kinase pkn1 [Geobacter sp. OR-1]|uniref:formylglycine-generating enzyme family protein n=1 Tax=Geobacter sp. OR-1 TaxID=1266765 RepID=UPI000543A5AD|nr:formylglycine-generating enzyme family protein [Geobacter sp. OR-1]GAM09479.1 serine/threonine-protein kinase pkn1 [Geobacter sp. OR-1]